MLHLHRTGTLLLFLCLLLSAGCLGDGGGGGPTAPSNLTYPLESASYHVSEAILENKPTHSGSSSNFSVTPDLPTGLTLNTSSGAISGTPTAPQPATGYTVKASNHAGSTTALISIEIFTDRFAFATATADDTLLGYTVHGDQLIFNGFTVAPAGEAGPGEALASPDGAFLYVPNNDTANISIYTVDGEDGALNAGSPVAVGAGPQTMLMNESGSLAFVASAGANELRSFSVDALSGALTQVGTALATDDDPVALAISSDSAFLFVAGTTNPGYLHTYAVAEDGSLSSAGAPYNTQNGSPSALAITPNDEVLLASFDAYNLIASFTIDPSSGALEIINTVPSGTDIVALSALPSGSAALALISGGGTQQQLRAIPVDASGTLGTPVVTDIDGGPVALALSGTRAFVTSADDGEVDLYAIDPATAEPTFLRSFRTRGDPSGFILANATSALAPRASQVYSVNSGADSISTFAVESTDGTLTAGPETPTSAGPRALALDPLGEYAYIACPSANTIEICTVNALTGELTVAISHTLGSDEPYALCLDAAGTNLYVATHMFDGDGQLDTFPIDRPTGNLGIRIGLPLAALPRQLALDPTGRFLFVATEENGSSIETFDIDPHNGFPAPVHTEQTSNGATDVTLRFAPSGARLFIAYDADPAQLLFSAAIDSSTGELSLGGVLNTAPGTAQALEPHPSGRFAFVAVQESSNDHTSSFDLDEATGALSNETEHLAGLSPADLRIDPTGNFLWVANEDGDDITLFTVDQDTGLLTQTATISTGTTPTALTLGTVLE